MPQLTHIYNIINNDIVIPLMLTIYHSQPFIGYVKYNTSGKHMRAQRSHKQIKESQNKQFFNTQ